jgi:creatinine amidohydrolase
MVSTATGLFVEETTWREVRRRVLGGATAVLPVGASCKQHGDHLPMDADRVQAEWFARRLAERRDVLVWPTLNYGHYPAFVRYPGSISLGAETFAGLAREVVEGIADAGPRRVVVLNAGISTIVPLRRALDPPPPGVETALVNLYEGPAFDRSARRLQQQRLGTHADEIETSLLLAIDPGRVHLERARPWDGRPLEPPFDPFDPASPGYSPSGAYGDPTRATAAKGQALAEAILEDILENFN